MTDLINSSIPEIDLKRDISHSIPAKALLLACFKSKPKILMKAFYFIREIWKLYSKKFHERVKK